MLLLTENVNATNVFISIFYSSVSTFYLSFKLCILYYHRYSFRCCNKFSMNYCFLYTNELKIALIEKSLGKWATSCLITVPKGQIRLLLLTVGTWGVTDWQISWSSRSLSYCFLSYPCHKTSSPASISQLLIISRDEK